MPNSGTEFTQDLIIRARDLSSETLKQVDQALNSTVESLNRFSEAAKKGEGNQTQLKNAMADADKVLRTLLGNENAIRRYMEAFDAAPDKAKAVEQMRKEFEAFSATLGNFAPTVAANQREQEKLNKAVKDASAAFKEAKEAAGPVKQQTEEQKTSLKGLGDAYEAAKERAKSFRDASKEAAKVTADQAAEQQRLMAALKSAEADQRRNTGTLNRLGPAMDTLGLDRTDMAALAVAQKQVQEGIMQTRIAVTEAARAEDGLTDAVKRRIAAEKGAADQVREMARVAETNAVREQRWADQKAQAADKEARNAAQFNALRMQYAEQQAESDRKAAAQAAEADRIRYLGLNAAVQAAQFQRAGARPDQSPGTTAVTGALNPNAIQDVNSLNKALQETVSILGTVKLTEDDARQGVKKLAEARQEIIRQVGMVDQFRRESAELARLQSVTDGYGGDIAKLASRMRNMADADVVKLAGEQTKLAENFKRATMATNEQKERLDTLAVAMTKAGLNSNNLDGEVRRLTGSAALLGVSAEKADKVLNQNKQSTGFLGLKNYELQNLSYQMNDIVTQLSSGTALTQVLAQQGGQVFQIFEKNIFAYTRYLGVIGAGAAALFVAYEALSRAASDQTAVRSYQARLTVFGETATATGQQLLGVTKEIEKFGASFDEAKEVVLVFQNEGLRTDRMVAFGRAAQTMTDIFGTKLPEAAKMFAVAAKGTESGIKALNDQLHFLTPELQAAIDREMDLGNALNAGKLATDAATEALKRAEADGVSPLTKATRELKNEWHSFLEQIGAEKAWADLKSYIAVTLRELNDLLGIITAIPRALGMMDAAASKSTTLIDSQIAAKEKQLADAGGENAPGAAALARSLAELRSRREAGVRAGVNTAGDLAAPLSPQDRPGDPTMRQRVDAGTVAKRSEDEEALRFDARLRGDAARAQDAGYATKVREKAYQDAVAKMANPINLGEVNGQSPMEFQRLKKQVDEAVTRAIRERTEARNNAFNNENRSELDELGNSFRAGGRKGSAALEEDRRVIDDRIRRASITEANKLGQSLEQYERENQANIAKIREDGYAEAARKRGQQDKSAADKRAGAEESAEKQIAALREKLGNADKTNLNERLKALDAEVDKYRVIARSVARRGADTSELNKEIDQFAIRRREQLVQEAGEAGINTLIKARQDMIGAINSRIEKGSLSLAEGAKLTNEYLAKATPEIVDMARKTLAVAEAIGGLTPSPRISKLIEDLKAILANPNSLDPTKTGAKGEDGNLSNVDASIRNAQGSERTRQDTVKANRESYAANGQTYYETQDKIKASYDRTTVSIRNQTAAARTELNVLRQSGKITDDQYEQRMAQINKLNAGTEYQSDLMSGLSKETENAFGAGAQTLVSGMVSELGKVAAGQQTIGQTMQNIGLIFVQVIAQILQQIAMWIIKTLVQIELQAVLASLSGGVSTVAQGAAGAATTAATTATQTATNAAVQGISQGVAQGATQGAVTATAAAVRHGGGMIGPGENGMTRWVPQAAFINAPRFHEGTMVGLASNEQAAILEHGEEVLSKNDPRNAMNGGKDGKETVSSQNLRVVNVLNPKDISAAMAGAHGDRVIINAIKNNSGIVKQLVK